MGIYEEIVGAATAADPTGAPGEVNHPDSCRMALSAIRERRAASERVRAEAMLDLAVWARSAVDAGVSVVEVAQLAGVTRATVYAAMRGE